MCDEHGRIQLKFKKGTAHWGDPDIDYLIIYADERSQHNTAAAVQCAEYNMV